MLPRRPPSRILLALCAGGTLLVVASYLSLVVGGESFQVGSEGHRLLNVGAEANLPTWWTSVLLAAGGTGFLVRARELRTVRETPVGEAAWADALVGVLLVTMSVDELAGIHELLVHPAEALTAGSVSFTWLLLGAPLAVAVLALALMAGRRLAPGPRRLLLGGLVVFLLGAVALEATGSWLSSRELYATRLGVAVYHLEELLEMLGAALLTVAPPAWVRTSPARASDGRADVRPARRAVPCVRDDSAPVARATLRSAGV